MRKNGKVGSNQRAGWQLQRSLAPETVGHEPVLVHPNTTGRKPAPVHPSAISQPAFLPSAGSELRP